MNEKGTTMGMNRWDIMNEGKSLNGREKIIEWSGKKSDGRENDLVNASSAWWVKHEVLS